MARPPAPCASRAPYECLLGGRYVSEPTTAELRDTKQLKRRAVDDRLNDVGIDRRHPSPERVTGHRPQAFDRLASVEEREVGSEDQFVRDAILDRLNERLVEQVAPRDKGGNVGVHVRMTPNHCDRLTRPRVADVRDHDR